MTTPQDPDTRLRSQVFDAALPLLQEQGYFYLNPKNLSARCGIAESTITALFPQGNDQLICEAMNYWAPTSLGGLRDILEAAPDTASALEAIFTYGGKSMQASNNINVCPIAILALSAALSSPKIQSICSNGMDQMANLFRKRLADDHIPPERLSDLALLLTTVFEGCFISARAQNNAAVLTAVGNQLADLLRSYLRELKNN